MKRKRECKSQEKNFKKQNENIKKRSKSPSNNLKEEKYKKISDLGDDSNKIGKFIDESKRNQRNYGENQFNSINQIGNNGNNNRENISNFADYFEKEMEIEDVNFKSQNYSLNNSNKYQNIIKNDNIKSLSEKTCLNKKTKREKYENQKESNSQTKSTNSQSVSKENQFKNTENSEDSEDSDNNRLSNDDLLENNNSFNNHDSINDDDDNNNNSNNNITNNKNININYINNNNDIIKEKYNKNIFHFNGVDYYCNNTSDINNSFNNINNINNSFNYINNNINNINNNINNINKISIITFINKITKIVINNINNHIISNNNNNIKNAINNDIIDIINNKIKNNNKNKDSKYIESLNPFNYTHFEQNYYYYYKHYMTIKPKFITIEYIISDKKLFKELTKITGIYFENENDLIKKIKSGIIYQNLMNYLTKGEKKNNIIVEYGIKKFMPAEMIDVIKTILLNIIIEITNSFEEMKKNNKEIKKIDNDLINNKIKAHFNCVLFDMPLFLIVSNDSKYKNAKNLNKETILNILNSKKESKDLLELIKYLILKVKDILDIIRNIKIDPTGKNISEKFFVYLQKKYDDFGKNVQKKKDKDGLNKYIDLLYEKGYFDREITKEKVIDYIKKDYFWSLVVLAFNPDYFFDSINISRGFKNHGKLMKQFWRKVIIKIFYRKLKSFGLNNYKKV